MLSNIQGIYSEVMLERHAQDLTWGEQNHDPYKWLAILGEEVGEVNKAVLENHPQHFNGTKFKELREELIQVAAVAVAMIECGDRNDWWKDA